MVSEMHIAHDATALLDAIDRGAQISEVRPLSRALAQDAHVIEQERRVGQRSKRGSLSNRFAQARSSSDSLSASRTATAHEVHHGARGDARA